jgi:hypothetical protein
MKTKNLTFTEALTTLSEGKCKGIRPGVDNNYLVLEAGAQISESLVWSNSSKVPIPVCYFTGTWSLVEPEPEFVVEGFLNVYPTGVCFHRTEEKANMLAGDRRIGCLPFKYVKPFEDA